MEKGKFNHQDDELEILKLSPRMMLHSSDIAKDPHNTEEKMLTSRVKSI